MATTGEVQFGALLRAVTNKIKNINMFTSDSNEASYYKELENLATTANLMLEASNPKRALVTKTIIEQVAYYRATRIINPATGLTSDGKTTRSRQATAGHVADILEGLFPILDADPQVLIVEVEVPVNPVADVTTVVAPEYKAETPAKPSEAAPVEPKKSLFTAKNIGIAVAGLAILGVAGTVLTKKRKKNPRWRRNPEFRYTLGPVRANPRRGRRRRSR
ncbi:LPXTG cell wall anchor domain-containing protein [Patescibacteria group bacterium]|nr:LPXTG cell wall anchor domain-containing protein [Patescibacteria group bacterium]